MTTNNASLLNAAYVGALNGACSRWSVSSTAADYSTIVDASRALAEEVDSLIAADPLMNGEKTSIMNGICSGFFKDRYLVNDTALDYLSSAQSIVAIYTQAIASLEPVNFQVYMLRGAGPPQGSVTGPVGVQYYDETSEVLWLKHIGSDEFGWFPYAPEAPEGSPLADTAAQTVEISTGNWHELDVLSQDSTLTLGVQEPPLCAGAEMTVTRQDASAFTFAIINGGPGAGTLLTMPVSKKYSAVFQYDGTNWKLKLFGFIN